MTLVERQTHFEVIFKLNGKDAKSVDRAIQDLKKRLGDYFTRLFKTITSDNGFEFSGSHEFLQDAVDVCFSHRYASGENGTSENQHKIIRRFIPIGSPISHLNESQLIGI